MKKLLLTLGVVLFSLNMSAQLVFVDKDGKEIADGATIIMDKAVKNDWDEMEVALDGLSIKNTSSSKQTFTMEVEVTAIPNGGFSCCYGTTCKNISSEGTMTLKNLTIDGNESVKITSTEWCPDEEKYGTCSVTFKLVGGNSVNVNFIYPDPAFINLANITKKIVAIYDLAGNRIKVLQRGINLVRYSDGSVRKRIVR